MVVMPARMSPADVQLLLQLARQRLLRTLPRLHLPARKLPLQQKRLICATLEKIRMPRTTITPVDSCPPTPSLSPRYTIAAAITTLLRKETTNTLSSKIPSR